MASKAGKEHLSWYNILIVAFATFGSISFGYCASIIGTTITQPSFVKFFGLDTAGNASALEGAMNGLFQAGGLIGCLSFGFAADKLGRCKAIFIATAVTILGGVLQTGSVAIAMFLVARFVTSYGISGLIMLVPFWQSDVSPPHSRGLLVGLHGVRILIGYDLASWTGYGFFFVRYGDVQWLVPLALQIISPFILACGVWFMTEPPFWLMDRGQSGQALAVLAVDKFLQ